mmetsp:Transcript_4131/g.9359  ORF Transcript_4131/g.9359 Transcript_4131/m.9359 type:complete len:234 (+) Transcript_4131:440-1141(+)
MLAICLSARARRSSSSSSSRSATSSAWTSSSTRMGDLAALGLSTSRRKRTARRQWKRSTATSSTAVRSPSLRERRQRAAVGAAVAAAGGAAVVARAADRGARAVEVGAGVAMDAGEVAGVGRRAEAPPPQRRACALLSKSHAQHEGALIAVFAAVATDITTGLASSQRTWAWCRSCASGQDGKGAALDLQERAFRHAYRCVEEQASLWFAFRISESGCRHNRHMVVSVLPFLV